MPKTTNTDKQLKKILAKAVEPPRPDPKPKWVAKLEKEGFTVTHY